MSLFRTYHILSFVLVITHQGVLAQVPSLKSANYVISMDYGINQNELQKFALREFKSRARPQILIENQKNAGKNDKILVFKINSSPDHTYCVEHSEKTLVLEANNLEIGKWLVYQFIEALSQEDHRISASDLPPAHVNFHSHCDSFDFEYREPHFPTNLKPGNTDIFGTNSVDSHWGLWGHNLSKITTPDPDIFAEINEEKNKSQFCFTSRVLYEQVSNFIIENYGYGAEKSFRFVIMPEDNGLVCSCPTCEKTGNTNYSATPAVSEFITKLATQFPKHLFFTSSYRTTTELPECELPDNTGVFLSTIDLAQGIQLNNNHNAIVKFKSDIAAWKKRTPHVYVWDYIANFDDYLTPVPVLYSLQKRLLFFKKEGVKGVFLNGSGYDYASFEDVKTYISSILMQTNTVDIDHFIRAYFKKFYPEFHQLLSDYYIQLEKDFSVKNTSLNIYGGMEENLISYLDKKSFLQFYDNFEELKNSKQLANELKKLGLAINFTKLQIAYVEKYGAEGFVSLENGRVASRKHIADIVENLKVFRETENLNNYREENGDLETYISNWEHILKTKNLENRLLNQSVESNPSGYQDQISKLADGIPGFPPDYHMGWFITDRSIAFRFRAPEQGKKTVQLRFMVNGRHRFYAPKDIQIHINGVSTEANFRTEKHENTVQIEIDVFMQKEDEVILFLHNQDKTKSKIALDEIRIL